MVMRNYNVPEILYVKKFIIEKINPELENKIDYQSIKRTGTDYQFTANDSAHDTISITYLFKDNEERVLRMGPADNQIDSKLTHIAEFSTDSDSNSTLHNTHLEKIIEFINPKSKLLNHKDAA